MTGDEQLMARLRRAVSRLDPVPGPVLAGAGAALSTRRLDEELAGLLMDSARAGNGDVRLLSFGTGRLTVELRLGPAGDQVPVRGLVTGLAGEVTIEQPGHRHSVPVDPAGSFTSAAPPGPTRMRLRDSAGCPVLTSWVVL